MRYAFVLSFVFVFMGAACGGSDQTTRGASCVDGIHNGTESGVDCGGTVCGSCEVGNGCVLDSDCLSGVCDLGVCGCPAGYADNGARGCMDVDECAGPHDCAVGATCTNTVGGYTCACAPGYLGDGKECSVCAAGTWGADCTEVCEPGRCTGEVHCDLLTGVSVSCTGCAVGFHGVTCESPCAVGACVGDVTCEQASGVAVSCPSCAAGWWGPACAAECAAGACVGVMTCDQVTGAAIACDGRCAVGSSGATCEVTCAHADCVACTSTGQCDAGSICIDGLCLRDDGEVCSADHQCVGVCVGGACAPISGTGGECDDELDCVDGHVCVGGICLREIGRPCDDDEQCDGICYAGACRVPAETGGLCEERSDCVDSHECVGGVCLRENGQGCEGNAVCAGVCVSGICGAPSGTGGPCDERDDCAAGRACVDGICLLDDGQACASNAVCVGICALGTCREMSGFDGVCDEDVDCAAGLACSTGGRCRLVDGSACTANGDCHHTCVGGVCVPHVSTSGFCEQADDCVEGHLCLANVCLRQVGSACDSNALCAGVCVLGQCGARSAIDGPCDETADCQSGYSCIGQRCLYDAGSACTANEQCAEVCIDLVCQPRSSTGGACDATNDCVANHSCVNRVCLAEAGQPCDDNRQCVAVCIGDTCGPVSGFDGACDEVADCASGLLCNAEDLCKRAEGGQCVADTECATPNTACVGGACTTDDTPNGFAFENLGCRPTGSEVTSNTVALSGFHGPLTLTAGGAGQPTLIHNGAAADGGVATVRAGDTFALRMRAPSTSQSTAIGTATIGQLMRSWEVRTAPNMAPGQAVKTESNVISGGTRDAVGQAFGVPETGVFAVHTYMYCRDRIHNGEYHYTNCYAYLERQNGDGSWSSIIGHTHNNGQCCTAQSYVLDRTTNATLTAGTNYRFRYAARPRSDRATTVYGSSADVKFLACE